MMITAAQLVERLGLHPLPEEGGLFSQSYVSAESLAEASLPPRYSAAHPFCTAIFYLLTDAPDSFSALHRLPTDEIYHFYLGDPVEMLHLYPDGSSEAVFLGHDVMAGQKVQHVAPAGAWQGSRLRPGGRLALLGTTMAPGYIGADYTGGDREELIRQHPGRAEMIRTLTRR